MLVEEAKKLRVPGLVAKAARHQSQTGEVVPPSPPGGLRLVIAHRHSIVSSLEV